jgi:hypothetical protein
VLQDGGGVGDISVLSVHATPGWAIETIDEPDHDGGRTGARGQAIESGETCSDEIRAEDEILRRVAVDGQFREEQDVGPLPLRPPHGLVDALLVARDVADAEVELGPGDTYWHNATIRPVIPCRRDRAKSLDAAPG